MTGAEVETSPDGTTERRLINGLAVVLPDDWWRLPLEEKTRHQAIAAMVDERVALQPPLARFRNDLVSQFRRAARSAADNGAVLCAQWTHATTDEALAANLLALVRPVTVEEGGVPTSDVDALLLALRADPGEDQVTVRELGVVDLPGVGRVVRLHSRRSPKLQGLARATPLVSVQFFVPTPVGSLVILTMTSPSIGYESELVALFDVLAQTLVFTLEGDDEFYVARIDLLPVQPRALTLVAAPDGKPDGKPGGEEPAGD